MINGEKYSFDEVQEAIRMIAHNYAKLYKLVHTKKDEWVNVWGVKDVQCTTFFSDPFSCKDSYFGHQVDGTDSISLDLHWGTPRICFRYHPILPDGSHGSVQMCSLFYSFVRRNEDGTGDPSEMRFGGMNVSGEIALELTLRLKSEIEKQLVLYRLCKDRLDQTN